MRDLKVTQVVLLAFILTIGTFTWAQEKTLPVQARFFAGATSINPAEINALLSNGGVTPYTNILQFGVEGTYPLIRFLDIGLRYTHRNILQGDVFANHGLLRQDSLMGIARVPVLRSKFLKFDAYAGIGGSNTVFSIKTPSDDGTLKREVTGDNYASLISSYGISAGVGFKKFFLFVEAGVDKNQVTKLVSSGTISGTVNTIDNSGRYVLVGLLFDGMTATQTQ